MRKDWDQYFLDIADLVATRATCDRLHVGAVLVGEDHQIISTGYNGSIRGEAHCDDTPGWRCNICGDFQTEEPPLTSSEGKSCRARIPLHFGTHVCTGVYQKVDGGHDIEDSHCVRTIHAEVNAICQAARHGISTSGSTLYCNWMPCWNCFKVLAGAGVREIVYSKIYRPDLRVQQAKQGNSSRPTIRQYPASQPDRASSSS